MFAWREDVAGVTVAVTDRHQGVSRGPYAQLNLGAGSGDDMATVRGNRRAVAIALGADDVVFARQVHGSDVIAVDRPWDGEPSPADALVTTTPGVAIGVLVADCVPVMLLDADNGVAGVAHAGRRGMAAGIALALVTAMRDLGATALVGRVGPAICGRCYEVPLEMREDVAATVPEARAVTSTGRPSLDLGAGVMAQLAPHCVDLRWLPGCTNENSDLYSYRRDGVTGRYAGIVLLP